MHPAAPGPPVGPGVARRLGGRRDAQSGEPGAGHRRHDGPVDDLERIRAESVASFRALDENATPRRHFHHADEEDGLWYIEAVPDRGEWVVIKQAELTSAGRFHRYGREHPEDEHGGLTDRAIDPEEDPLETISAEEFQRVWTR